jgi:hypothetical protein
MVRRLCLNEMRCTAASVSPIIRGAYSATAAPPLTSLDADRPVRPDQLQEDSPLHPALPVITTGRFHSTPSFWTVSCYEAGDHHC